MHYPTYDNLINVETEYWRDTSKLSYFLAGLNVTILGFIFTQIILGNLVYFEKLSGYFWLLFGVCFFFCIINIWLSNLCRRLELDYYFQLNEAKSKEEIKKESNKLFAELIKSYSSKIDPQIIKNYLNADEKFKKEIETAYSKAATAHKKIWSSFSTKALNISYYLLVAVHLIGYPATIIIGMNKVNEINMKLKSINSPVQTIN